MANPIVQQINTELLTLQKELTQFKQTVDYLNNAKSAVKDAVINVNHSEELFNGKVKELKNTYDSFIKLSETVSVVISKIDDINFPERLDKIESTVSDTITVLNETRTITLEELSVASKTITDVDFEGKFKELDKLINSSIQSANTLTQYISKLKIAERFEKLENKFETDLSNYSLKNEKNNSKISNEITKSIRDLNITTNFDIIKKSIEDVLLETENIKTNTESSISNLSIKVINALKKQSELIADNNKKNNDKIIKLENELKGKFELVLKRQQVLFFITLLIIVVLNMIIIYSRK